jgi:hypothetical protein
MPPAFDNQTQIIVPGKSNCRHDIVRRLGGDGIHTGSERPSVHPTQRLRETGFVADEVGITQFRK